jgi:prolyl oligopeptidase
MKNENSWLKSINGNRALKFVNKNNKETISKLSDGHKFEEIKNSISPIFQSKKRLPFFKTHGKYLYNLWQDNNNPQGIWRRTTFSKYIQNNVKWETILDLDRLGRIEKTNWSFSDSTFFDDSSPICLLSISDGGKDAIVVREFNVKTKKFIKSGFNIPEAKSDFAWLNENHLYVSTDCGKGSLTKSGYPRTIKLWKRGTPLSSAEIVFKVGAKDLSAGVIVDGDEKRDYIFYNRTISFYENEIYLLEGTRKIRLPFPKNSIFYGIFKEHAIFHLHSDLEKFKSGSLVSLPLSKIEDKNWIKKVKTIFTPSATSSFSEAYQTKDYLLIETLDKIMVKIEKVKLHKNSWKKSEVVSDLGSLRVSDIKGNSNLIYIHYYNFLTPSTLAYMDLNRHKKPITMKQDEQNFNSSDLIFKQKKVKSPDGTVIPYFIVHKKDIKLNSKNPTLLEGYGGFQTSMTPFYLGSLGKVWLEQGGVYVLANIRGGGEFGPSWHQSALKENRNKCFEDFIAIAEDLINKKITSPKNLGIQGSSNGGLLVGAVFTKRPDLFNAVLCEAPLLDMLNYHTMLAGSSWIDEYGDPRNLKMKSFLKSYSPLHNLVKNKLYPEVFFMASTKDDRVHPAHARQMVKKMQDQGHSVLYYEALEGGHCGNSDIDHTILWKTLEYSYLWKKLVS